MKINSPQFNLMQKACLKASRVLIRDFGEVEKLQVSEKGPGDFVTASDKRVEKIIINELEESTRTISSLRQYTFEDIKSVHQSTLISGFNKSNF